MIELRGVDRQYVRGSAEPVQALQDISLSLARGELVAITGSSGSGKSTLMNIVGLLDSPSAGSYVLDGREVSGLEPDELASLRNERIGFVFQAFHLLPRTSALENVELPLVYSNRSDLQGLAREALRAVGLEDRIHHRPKELSGGQQQRVAIARALVNGPEILLADEPTGNLDTRAGLEIISIFQDLNRQGKTVVLVTHDPNLASLCGRVVRLEDGRVVGDAPVEPQRDAAEELAKLPTPTAA